MVYELSTFDFSEIAQHIFNIATVLSTAGILRSMPYKDTKDVLKIIKKLLQDIDPNLVDHQITELKHIRMEYLDEMLSVEFFIGA